MKNVGIVTWFESENYGTALQAFALNDVLHRMGYNPYIVASFDFKHFGFDAMARRILDSMGLLLYLRSHFVGCVNRKRKIRIYDFFRKNCQVLRINSNSQYKQLLAQIPEFVTGSDQIWNPNFLEQFYLLDFAGSNKRVGYSSSIGVAEIPKDMQDLYYNHLRKFSKIGLREGQAVKVVNELLGEKKAIKVVDPTLLVSKDGWNDLIAKSELSIQEDYLLCYLIGNRKEYSTFVAHVQKKLGIQKVFVITSAENDKICLKGVNAIYLHEAGLEDFAYLIGNAKFVCTDSFHATAISIKLEKDFVEFMRFADDDPKSQNSRITDILSRYNLSDRIFNIEKDVCLGPIDYTPVNETLGLDIHYSSKFLKESLG